MIKKKINFNYIYSLISGLLVGLAYPPFNAAYGVFFILIPFLIALENSNTKKSYFINGFIFGFIASFSAMWWIMLNVGAAFIVRIISGLCLYLLIGVIYGLGLVLIYYLRDFFGKYVLLLLPLLFLGVEHLFLYEEIAFPWLNIANTATYLLNFIQIAEFGGSLIVSFLIVLVNVLLFYSYLLAKDRKILKATTLLLFVLTVVVSLEFWGKERILELRKELEVNPKIKVALVYPNLIATEKWKKSNFNKIIDWQFLTTDSLLNKDPNISLIIWGETNFPGYLEKYPYYYKKFKKISQKRETDLFIGALGFDLLEKGYKKYNSAFFFSEISGRYDKIKLVPFGEAFPFSSYFPAVKNISLGQANFDRGDSAKVFRGRNYKFSPSICYEGIFPYLNAEFTKNGAEFLVNISNDSWFEETPENSQHSRFNIFRAIENRRSIVRLANRAENSLIDYSGKLNLLFNKYQKGGYPVTVPVNKKITFFTKNYQTIKYLVIYLNLTILLISLILFFKKHNKKRLK